MEKIGSTTIIFTMLGLLIGGLFFYAMATTELNGEKTDCYDRYRNKIQGQTCIVEGKFDSQEIAYLFGSIALIALTFLMGFVGYMIDDLSRVSKW